MSLDACAALVQRGDPDRFATLMAAPVPVRARLLPIYAFNLEVARAPWVTEQELIAEMRLQWWRDVAEEIGQGKTRAHEVVGPLADAMGGLPVDLLDRIAEARRWDIYREPFASEDELWTYLDDTAGGLMWLSALALGADARHEAAVRGLGQAAGLAAFLRAVPELRERGRRPLPHDDIAGLAQRGLERAGRVSVPRRVAPALWPAWQTRGLLTLAAREPQRVEAGTLAVPEFRKRWGLLWRAATGRA